MKRLLAILLVMIWIVSSAFAEELPHGLQLEINGMSLTSELADEKSDTHDWLAVDVTVTNWDMEPASLSGRIAAYLTYMEQYSFDAELVFATDSIEPLVQLDGTLLYRIPKMVSETLEKAKMSISVEGNTTNPEIVIGSRQTNRSTDRLECDGFDTPEDAVKAYIEAFNAGDIPGMISTFAIETYVEHVDRRAMIEKTNSFNILSYDFFPMPSEYSRNLLASERWGELVSYLGHQYLLYSWPREGFEYPSFSLKFEGEDPSAEISTFLDTFNNAEIHSWAGNIEFIDFISIEEAGLYEKYNEWVQRNINDQIKLYGYDEMQNLIAHIRINGEDYIQLMQCARYGDDWYNHSFGGVIASLVGLNYKCAGLAPKAILNAY